MYASRRGVLGKIEDVLPLPNSILICLFLLKKSLSQTICLFGRLFSSGNGFFDVRRQIDVLDLW